MGQTEPAGSVPRPWLSPEIALIEDKAALAHLAANDGAKVMDSRTTHESTIEEDIRGLVEAFEQRSLPRALWTHQAHLLVALWYVMNYPEEEAIVRIREGIQAYNASLGNTSGYHETVTRAWISVIRSFLASRDGSRRVEKHASDLLERCGRPDYLLRFYSQDLLDSRQAREAWVAPDLAEIAPASV